MLLSVSRPCRRLCQTAFTAESVQFIRPTAHGGIRREESTIPAVADCGLWPQREFQLKKESSARKGSCGLKGHVWIKRKFIEHHLDDSIQYTTVDVTCVVCLEIVSDDVQNQPARGVITLLQYPFVCLVA